MSYLALKLGPKVPKGAINLAWVSIPEATPEQNTFVADLAGTIPANETDYSKQQLNPTITAYNLSLGESGVTKTVSSSVRGQYSSPIQVLPPVSDPAGGWHIRVMDGVFHQRLTVQGNDESWVRKAFHTGTEIVAIYTLPEKLITPHNTRFGDFTEFVGEDEAFPISSRAVQLSYRDIASLTRVTVNDVDMAFPLDLDTATENVNMSVDRMAGTITFLNRTIASTDDVRVSYGHRSPHITYYGYYDASGDYHDLDLNPAYGHTYDNGKPTGQLVGKVITLFLIPTAAYDYRASLDGEVSIIRAQDILADTPEDLTFLRWGADLLQGLPEIPDPKDDGTVKSVPRGSYGSAKYGRDHFCTTTPEGESGWDNYSVQDGAAADLLDYPSAAVLARVYIAPTGTAESVIVTDTRRRGGGLTDDPILRRAVLNGEQLLEANTCWDVSGWDGDPVMLNGTTVIELPEALLSRRGGKFAEAEVEELVRKRLPVGVLPIIRYTVTTVTDETANYVSDDEIQLSRQNIASIDSVKWNTVLLSPADYEVDLAAGSFALTGSQPEPTEILVTYKY